MPSAHWSKRQARWSQVFEQFGGLIEYVHGKSNLVADALSRKGQVLAIQAGSTIQIQGISFDEMNEKEDPNF